MTEWERLPSLWQLWGTVAEERRSPGPPGGLFCYCLKTMSFQPQAVGPAFHNKNVSTQILVSLKFPHKNLNLSLLRQTVTHGPLSFLSSFFYSELRVHLRWQSLGPHLGLGEGVSARQHSGGPGISLTSYLLGTSFAGHSNFLWV